MNTVANGALHGLRVLDLGGEITNYCGRMFAQLGAEVILVEPVSGSTYRSSHPQSTSTGESLRFIYDNSDKQSIALNLATETGQKIFRELAASSDLLLDDRTQHDLRKHGLSYEDTQTEFPSLVQTVITPFGLSGPYAHYTATDATCLAFGGMLWLGGYEDAEPVQAAGNQAFRAGSLFGAVASMAALVSSPKADSARGEFIDVSVQECVSLGLENAIQFYDLEEHVRRRHGGKQKQAGFGVFPCTDGYVFLIAGGIGGNRFWSNFTEWLKSEGVPEAELLEEQRWWDRGFVEGEEAKNIFWDIFTGFSSTRTKEELLEAAIKWNVPLSPVKTIAEVHQSEQLHAREFFTPIQHGDQQVDSVGAPYRLMETPWQTQSAAPKPGQHTVELLRSIGYSDESITAMKQNKEVS